MLIKNDNRKDSIIDGMLYVMTTAIARESAKLNLDLIQKKISTQEFEIAQLSLQRLQATLEDDFKVFETEKKNE